jgi:hypothetical protein
MESVPEITIFLTKNDGEKWSRKNIFEISPCGKLFFLLHKWEGFCLKLQIQYQKSHTFRMEVFQKYFF